MNDADQPQIDAIARAIRTALYEAKSRGLKHKYKPKPKHDQPKFFQKAAIQCIALEADPVDYVEACVQNCTIPRGPFSNQLFGPAAKRWYMDFLAGKGIDTQDLRRRKKVISTDVGGEQIETETFELVYACDADLQMDIEIVLSLFLHNTGTQDPESPDNIALLRRRDVEIPIAARALLGYGDETVLKTFAVDIHSFFETHPNYLAAARRMDYPIDTILTWIRNLLIGSRP